MGELIVLDVGHGSCSLIEDNGLIAVVDAPIGSLLIDTLRERGIDRIYAAFISHADKDHLGGILSLLSSDDIRIDHLYVNPDSHKKGQAWRQLRSLVHNAERKGTCHVTTSLTTTTPGTVAIGSTNVTVVSPSASLALTGVGGTTSDGRTVTSNSMASALRIDHGGIHAALLASDIDAISLDDAIATGADLSAKILVFPHHGGMSGSGNAQIFVARLLDAVMPESVVFSNGRNRYDNPRKEIVLKVVAMGCSVSCTQMSRRCSAASVAPDSPHLESIRASGRASGSSCAGSMTFDLGNGGQRMQNRVKQFEDFIADHVATPMCRPSPGT